MNLRASWLKLPRGPAGGAGWVAVGVLVRSDDRIAFGPRGGFEGITRLPTICAAVRGIPEVDRLWAYLQERGVGGESQFGAVYDVDAPTLGDGMRAALATAPETAPA